MTSNTLPEAPSAPAARPAQARWPRTWLMLALILLLGASFSTLNLFGWDGGTGQHPDERFMTDVASRLHVPTSLGQYLDSEHNPLNPRNVDKTFYVYGLLPQTLTHYTAVLLTPDSALPKTVLAPSPQNYGSGPQLPNPDLLVPKLRPLQALLNPAGDDLTNYYAVYKVGRAWSALFALLSVLVVFLIGRRLYGDRVGLLAALLLALAVLPIQIAHFFTVDSATAFFTLLSIYWAVRLAQNGGLGSSLALGLSIGAAMACRVTMATLGLLAVLAIAQRWLSGPSAQAVLAEWLPGDDSVYYTPRARKLGFLSGAALLVVAGIITLVTFRMLQPDAFVGTSFFDVRPDPRFISNITEIGTMISGQSDSPPGQQWANRTPFVFALQNMIVWGLGPLLGLAAWISWAVAGVLLARAVWEGWNGRGWQLLRRRLPHLLPWTWIAFYFAWQGGQFVTTMRYYLLLYGLLALFAAWGLVRLAERRVQISDWAGKKSAIYNLRSALYWLPLVLVLAGSLGWAYAFTRIYTRPHSRVTASRWIYEHVPAGSALTAEEWDDALPLSIDGRRSYDPQSGGSYYGVKTSPYAEDDKIKYTGYTDSNGKYVPGLFDDLDQADYVVLSSNRVYGSATRLPMRYPALTRYYHYLFSGELGFEQVADITSYPTLFGIAIPDQSAEEAFSVYDHPRVLIFKKTADYSREKAEQLISAGVAWDEVYKVTTLRGGRVPTALRLTDAQWPSYRDAGTWAAWFDPASLASQLPWLPWLLVLELLGFSMFPWLFRLFPRLPDRGFALSKTLGLLLVAYAAWLLGSLKLLAFGPLSVWLCAGVLVLGGGLLAWRARGELRAFVRQRRAALITAEGLFLLAFFGFLIIRALNPDLWHPARGGEKPMDLAFLTAVVKSPYFPPYDPWFAGGFINYYYFGFVLVGALVHLTTIAPATAYNLAIPSLFALTALGAWGVGFNLLGSKLSKETQRQAEEERLQRDDSSSPVLLVSSSATWPRRERRAIAAGLVAAMFVVLLGPLTQAIWYLPGTAQPFDGLQPQCQASYAAQQQPGCRGRTEWAFWDATRLVGMDLQDSTITEFPFFTFLFADLHAHMIALPLALAALGLMVALVKAKAKDQTAQAWLLPYSICLLLLALVIGALRATNTWDFPTYLGLGIVTLALIGWRRWQQGAQLPEVALAWLLGSLALLLGSTLLFLPFLRSFATDYAGFALWTGKHTPAADVLKINGFWLFLLWSGLLLLYRRRGMSLLALALISAGGLALIVATLLLRLDALVLLVPMAGLAIGVVVDLLLEAGRQPPRQLQQPDHSDPYVQLRLPIGDLAEREGEIGQSPERAFTKLATLLPVVWAMAAVMLTLGTEVVVAKGDIGRMNTVFKFGMQSWVLFALASAVGLSALWPLATKPVAPADRALARGAGWAWRVVVLILVAAGLVYPLTATPARLADRIDPAIGPTLDGIAFMRSPKGSWAENNQQFDFVQDAAALDWMRSNISGTPIVLEAHTEAYRWGGRVSIYTGLPTLLGWPWHETQQRKVAGVEQVLANRQSLIQQLYSGSDPAATLQQLRLYGIEYVYVGKLERALYPEGGLAKFGELAKSGQIQQVYAQGDTQIYQVSRDSAPPAVLSTTLPTVAPVLKGTPETDRLPAPVYTLPNVGEYAWGRLAESQPVALLLWLLVCYALLALGLPAALLVWGRSRFGAGAYAWARLIGLLLLGYAIWLPVSAGLWSYNRWGLLWGMLLVLALNAAILVQLGRQKHGKESLTSRIAGSAGNATPASRSAQFQGGLALIRDHFRAHRRGILIAEAVFLFGLLLMISLRAFNPDLWQPYWGGEKPFEFGFLNAILRSPAMPPYDPFFSDGTINYYYYGLFLVSIPVKATGIDPAIAFNLIVPLLFAMTLAGAYAVVARIAGRVRYGLVGGVAVALLGNLAAAFQVGWGQGLAPARAALGGGLSEFGTRLDSWFVGPSRVIEIPDKLLTINEFPFWSYLFADLHPHLIAMPITLLVIALAYELFAQESKAKDQAAPEAASPTGDQGRLSALVFGLAPFGLAALALGALAVTNSWDFPTYALVLGGALLGRAWRTAGGEGWRKAASLAEALLAAGAIAVVALLLYLPFFQNFVRPAGVTGIGLVRDGSPLGQFLLVYGLYLLILAIWIVDLSVRLLRRRWAGSPVASRVADAAPESSASLGIVARRAALRPFQTLRLALWVALAMAVLLAVLQPQIAADLWASPLPVKLGLFGLLLAGIPALLARRLSAQAWFIAWLAMAGWAVLLGVELIYIRDHLDGGEAYRMNTVFKFGLQAWILLSVAAAAALPRVFGGLRRAGVLPLLLGSAAIATLVALALVFPIVGIPSRLAFRFPQTAGVTLDGLAFMDRGVYNWQDHDIALHDDAEAIRWLNANIEGTPIVLQSSLEFYRAYGVRIAANTGLPTVVSPLHASEQHNPDQVAERDRDVQEIYATLDSNQALRLLSKYHVGYLYVGPIERAAYGDAGVDKFEQLVGMYMSVAYQNAGVKIYQLNESVYGLNAGTDMPPPPEPQPQPGQQQPNQPPDQPPPDQPAQPQPQPADQPTLEELEQQVSNDPTAAGPAFGLAQRYRELERFDDAAAVLNVAAPANPNDVALQQLWGDTLRDAGRPDEAEAAYRAAIAAAPNAGNYNKLGVELMRFGKLDKAAEAFTQATAADANLADPYFHLGEIYEQQGQAEQAVAQYRAYLTIATASGQFASQATAAIERLNK